MVDISDFKENMLLECGFHKLVQSKLWRWTQLGNTIGGVMIRVERKLCCFQSTAMVLSILKAHQRIKRESFTTIPLVTSRLQLLGLYCLSLHQFKSDGDVISFFHDAEEVSSVCQMVQPMAQCRVLPSLMIIQEYRLQSNHDRLTLRQHKPS